ncbi:MAG: FMN-binding protein [Candidatus Paceibacterota bacterium]|jgi:electron transport complex protein RnfG
MSDEKSMTNVTTRLAIGGTICAFLMACTVAITLLPIAENARIATEKAVYAVFPGSAKYTEFAIDGNVLKAVNAQTPKDADRVYATYDAGGKLSGVTFKAKARGFQDDVVVLYGYNPEKECITGYKVLKSNETAGFGSKISTDENFMKNFTCLDVRLNAEKTGLLNRIKMTASGKKANQWEFDAITSATITSRAVEKMLVGGTEKIIPIIAKNMDTLQKGNE